jgi:MoaA/NifB/PqqE/SkfB family radical SAM enzyme
MTLMHRLDTLTAIAPSHRCVAPPAPPSTKVELTSRCNYACSFCAKASKLRTQGDMEFAEFTRIAHELYDSGVREIGLFYLGESFLVNWLEEAIATCRRIGFPYIFLTTNASLATPARVEACMAAGLNSLKFSLNWADAQQFEQVTGVKSKLYANANRNIMDAKRIRNAGEYDCKLYGSYVRYNSDQDERMASYLEDMAPHLDHIYALPLYTQAAHIDKERNPDWQFSVGNRGRADALREPLPCWALFTEAHVTWDSKLAACCFDHDGRFEMGDLKTESFMDAWHSEPFKALRATHLDGDVHNTVCETCIHG